jgi:2-polyprenyl-3-methyl-5-hydroxy-6-metoxy-1,4-benzoquinol methylase
MRDYIVESKDIEDSKYAYNFDYDVLHHYMMESFKPFFRNNTNVLELGSYEGMFTKRLLDYFDDITCIEASADAVASAKNKLGNKVTIINDLFEKARPPKKYDNIFLIHTLEHLDDPQLVLRRINKEWLSSFEGLLFLVCPNANAPSRHIAVKMGLISHNTAVTSSETAHGHRRTYTLDTLEQDAADAGLKVIYRTGIFFKALANFQWDKLMQTDIISNEYLEGCYKLGQLYPDLCASIFLLCEKGPA